MEKKKVVIIFILTLCLIAGIIPIINHVRQNIVFYRPVIIQFSGLNQSEIESIDCFSTGVFNHKNSIPVNDAIGGFVGYYSFRKDIILSIPEKVIPEIHTITIYYNGHIFAFDTASANLHVRNYLNNHKQGKAEIFLSHYIEPDSPGAGMLLSVFMWGGMARILYFAVLYVVMMFILVYFFRNSKYSIVRFIKKLFSHISEKTSEIAYSRAKIRIVTITLIVIYFIVFSFKLNPSNSASFSMDEFIYHSCGVNMALGEGICKLGGMEYFEQYKFQDYGANIEFNYKMFTRLKGLFCTFFPPGYSVFLGTVYKCAGVNPIVVKLIQLFLLVLVASLLPVLGLRLWGRLGYVSGLIGSLVFIFDYYNLAENLQPNAVLIFFSFLLFYNLVIYIEKKSAFSLILLAVFTVITLLIKGVLMLFILLFIFYLVYIAWKKRKKVFVLHALLFVAVVLLCILPWSGFATKENKKITLTEQEIIKKINFEPLTLQDEAFLHPLRNKYPDDFIHSNNNNNEEGFNLTQDSLNLLFSHEMSSSFVKSNLIFISSQMKGYYLLYAHNESIKTGGYNADWKYKKYSFYNTDHLEGKPYFLRILNFYLHNPIKIIELPVIKLHFAFSGFTWLIAGLISSILCFFYGMIATRFRKPNTLRVVLFILLNGFLGLIFILPLSRLFFYFFLTLVSACLCYFFFSKKRSVSEIIPVSGLLPILSLVLLTILGSGVPRQITPFAFFYILMGICFIFKLNIMLFDDKLPGDFLVNKRFDI